MARKAADNNPFGKKSPGRKPKKEAHHVDRRQLPEVAGMLTVTSEADLEQLACLEGSFVRIVPEPDTSPEEVEILRQRVEEWSAAVKVVPIQFTEPVVASEEADQGRSVREEVQEAVESLKADVDKGELWKLLEGILEEAGL